MFFFRKQHVVGQTLKNLKENRKKIEISLKNYLLVMVKFLSFIILPWRETSNLFVCFPGEDVR